MERLIYYEKLKLRSHISVWEKACIYENILLTAIFLFVLFNVATSAARSLIRREENKSLPRRTLKIGSTSEEDSYFRFPMIIQNYF